MKPETIKHFELRGWRQLHTALDTGCVFGKREENEQIVMAVDENGCTLSTSRFDEFAVNAGAARAVVQCLYEELQRKSYQKAM